MARAGTFDAAGVAAGWFDKSASADGWFDVSALGAGGSGGGDPAPLPHLGLLLAYSGAFTLAADVGGFALTGVAAALNVGRRAAADAGAFDLVGVAAGLEADRLLTANAGAFALAGQDATLSVTGVNAGGDPAPLPHLGLVLGVAVGGYTLTADAGAFAVAGVDAGLYADRLLTADVGAFDVVGIAAGLHPGLGLVADAGAFVVAGQDAGFVYHHRLTADVGAFALAGVPPLLKAGRLLTVDAGAFALAGQDATLTEAQIGSMEYPAPLPHLSLLLTGISGTYSLIANVGPFVVSGQAASLRQGKVLQAGAGAFVIAGAPAERDIVVTGERGAFVVAGQAAALTVTRPALVCAPGAFALNMRDAGLSYSGATKTLAGFTGVFTVVAQDVGKTRTRAIVADAGAFVVSGKDADYSTTGTIEFPAAIPVSGGVDFSLLRAWPQPARVPAKARRVIERVAKARPANIARALDEELDEAGLEMQAAYLDMVEALQARQIEKLNELERVLEAERQRALDQDDEDAIIALLLQ